MIKVVLVDFDEVINFRQAFWGEVLQKKYGKVFPLGYDKCMVGKADLKKILPKWHTQKMLEEWFAVENKRQDMSVLAVVDELRENGVKCYLASDQEKYKAGDVWRLVGEHFDGHFFSFEVGYLKVDPGYWQNILPQLGAKAEEIAFVDDNPANIEAAEKFGLVGRVYKEGSDLRNLLRV